jgi:hypothetical protein
VPQIPNDQVSPYALAVGASLTPPHEELPTRGAPRGTVSARGPPANALAYRINDAVQISGLGRTSLYKLIGDNRLRSVVVAGRRLVLASSLRELLEAA